MSVKKIYNPYKIRNLVASIGIFDGVHRGHQKILKKLVGEAKKRKTKSLVITFYPHPRKVLKSDSNIPLLTSLKHRLRLIEDFNVDFILVIKFTKYFSKMKAEDFVKKILVDKLNVKTLIVGKDFLFGYKERGDFRLLKNVSKKYGFKVFGIESLKLKKGLVSSTRVRHLIEKNNLKEASLMLGRKVTVLGTVVKGRRIGRKLGFPTANINPHHEAIPGSGVYTVDVRMKKKVYKGVLNIGTRPTFSKDKEPSIELHILNFKKDIYGKNIEITFKRRIRKERKFNSVEALRKQIKIDASNSK